MSPGMRNKFSSSLGLLALGTAALAAGSLTSCVEGTGASSVVVVTNEALGDDGSCEPTGVGTAFRARGHLDAFVATAIGRGYQLTPVVRNATSGETGSGRQTTAYVTSANVRITFSDPDLFTAAELQALQDDALLEYNYPIAGSIAAGGSAGFIIDVLPAALAAKIAEKLPADDRNASTLVLSSVSVLGDIGTSGFESQAFRYPIEVCNGCRSENVGACNAVMPTADVTTDTPNACSPGQDGVTFCCDGRDGLVCPAPDPVAPAAQ